MSEKETDFLQAFVTLIARAVATRGDQRLAGTMLATPTLEFLEAFNTYVDERAQKILAQEKGTS